MGKGTNWTDEEDVALCRAYMTVSEDRETGSSQSRRSLWESVAKEYDEITPDGSIVRPAKGLQSRYQSISRAATKFESLYQQVLKLQPSGMNEADMIERAQRNFRDEPDDHKDFKHIPCWKVLRKYKKFMTPSIQPPKPTNMDTHKRKAIEEDEGTKDMNTSLEQGRPGGSKEAKFSKSKELLRLNIMKDDVSSSSVLAEAQMKIANLKEQELRVKEATLEHEELKAFDLLFSDPQYRDCPEKEEYIKHRMYVAVKKAEFQAKKIKTLERGKQIVDEPILVSDEVEDEDENPTNPDVPGGYTTLLMSE